MSAETLRRAAELMRDRASRAEALRFWPSDDHDGMDETCTWPELVADLPGGDGLNAHVESWHPAVALAVAGWLDECVAEIEQTPFSYRDGLAYLHEHALTVARAYLGEAPTD